jgi:hypothetical protein
VLGVLELKGWISARRELVPPWRYQFSASQDMIYEMGEFTGFWAT